MGRRYSFCPCRSWDTCPSPTVPTQGPPGRDCPPRGSETGALYGAETRALASFQPGRRGAEARGEAPAAAERGSCGGRGCAALVCFWRRLVDALSSPQASKLAPASAKQRALFALRTLGGSHLSLSKLSGPRVCPHAYQGSPFPSNRQAQGRKPSLPQCDPSAFWALDQYSSTDWLK